MGISITKKPGRKTANRIPVAEGLFTWPSKHPRLIGTKCSDCGEIFFPQQRVCSYCSSLNTKETLFSRRGTLDLYTCTHYGPPGYAGELPLFVGFIRLPEGTRIISPIQKGDVKELKAGMKMQMVLNTVGTDDQGNELVSFAFAPISGT